MIATDHGTKIVEGNYLEVCSNPQVIEASLGRGARP
jgi:ABC-type branched-subunit amino acid transport system ATPase component